MGSSEINKAWKATCKILLKGEVGDLPDFEPYLTRYTDERKEKASSISGEKVIIDSMPYCSGARFISDAESSLFNSGRRKTLDINKLKDIDSIIENIGEICYAGNTVRGSSTEVEDSDNVFNSSFIYRCTDVYMDKFAAYTCNTRKSEYLFGCNWGGDSKFLIKCCQIFGQSRCFETLHTTNISDCYYSANLEGCINCMFSFNQRNKRNMIGNLELPQEKFLALKEKLIGEIRGMLKEKKSVPSIEEVMGGSNG